MTVLLAGGTGLVGSRLLPLLLASREQVVAVGRRPAGQGAHPALRQVQTDFRELPALPAAEVAISTLGTTIADAGSQQAFRAIDQHAVIAFARAARDSGCSRFICVTAVGASPSARAFYSRVKGETEQALAQIGFSRLDLVRPGLIIGPRATRRPVEALMQKLAPALDPLLRGSLRCYGSIPAEVIAKAIAVLARNDRPGVYVHHNAELDRLADS